MDGCIKFKNNDKLTKQQHMYLNLLGYLINLAISSKCDSNCM